MVDFDWSPIAGGIGAALGVGILAGTAARVLRSYDDRERERSGSRYKYNPYTGKRIRTTMYCREPQYRRMENLTIPVRAMPAMRRWY